MEVRLEPTGVGTEYVAVAGVSAAYVFCVIATWNEEGFYGFFGRQDVTILVFQ